MRVGSLGISRYDGLRCMAHILLVDDDPDACEVVSRLLKQDGYQVRSAPNGREALAALVSHTPDLVVLDLRMPEMDGLTLLEVIRSYLRWSDLPIIIVTAYANDPSATRANQLGVKHVFSKANYRLEDLLARVREYVPLRGRGQMA